PDPEPHRPVPPTPQHSTLNPQPRTPTPCQPVPPTPQQHSSLPPVPPTPARVLRVDPIAYPEPWTLSQKTSSKTHFLKSIPLQIRQLILYSPHKLTNL
ncbi:hypothetical protein T484DRAFT_1626869, partial [Baffinella frigidus]